MLKLCVLCKASLPRLLMLSSSFLGGVRFGLGFFFQDTALAQYFEEEIETEEDKRCSVVSF